jgi:hypothetical protein
LYTGIRIDSFIAVAYQRPMLAGTKRPPSRRGVSWLPMGGAGSPKKGGAPALRVPHHGVVAI